MPESKHCPSCGRDNAADALACIACNYPLAASATPAVSASASPPPPPSPVPAVEAAAPVAPPPAEGPAPRGFSPGGRPFRPIRPRPPRPQQPLQMQLWLITGVVAVGIVLFTAFRGFNESNFPPVEGAQQDQQKLADAAREALARDSTNTEARIALADVLYDTGNWTEAIEHYRAASRADSLRVSTWVDMGVCYYNLGQAREAEGHFEHALRIDAHHPVALFNMGIVHEQRQEFESALDFYHRAMNAAPPENMREPLVTRMKEVMAKLGRSAPALDGPPPGSTP